MTAAKQHKKLSRKNEEPASRTVYFSITGEAMVEVARNLLLSDQPGEAYRTLANGLIGDGATDAAISILRGESSLTGDSNVGLNLVTARKSKVLMAFKLDARYIYAGRYKTPRGWMRPVATVESYTDAYQSAAVVLNISGKRVGVLFEACNERPHWENSPIGAQEALDDFLKSGRKLPIMSTPADAVRKSKRLKLYPSRRNFFRTAKIEFDPDTEQAARFKQIGEDVRTRASSDTFILELKDGRRITVPRAPFARWALYRREELREASPAWENISTSGLKMELDNPDHTDWILGAGLTFEEAYSDVVSEPAWDAAYRLQEEARKSKTPKFAGIFAAIEQLRDARHNAAVIIDAGECTGVVGVDIAVFHDSKGDRVGDMGDSCKGVIVEQGGQLAHLIIVSRGRKITVMRHRNACDLFKPGATVVLNPTIGRISVIK